MREDPTIYLFISFAFGLLIGSAMSGIIARSAWRAQIKHRWPPFNIPDYDPLKYETRCPDCNAPYLYPPRCAPGYCAKVKRMAPRIAPVKTRGGTPGKDILE